ncbi:hypothetical protein IFM89_002217 [Coptis chinensis]|uniref:Helicase C-terminal domain-containing protein n=1 Tax=Coptis chinensis TaxID=261450 RepID=A0A835IL85_9MAGN|nr:hypothetical protein IFM89_002217 [Coptis chinensis]
MAELVNHPDAMKQVQEEVRKIAGKNPTFSLDISVILKDHPKRPGDEDPSPPYNMLRNVLDMNACFGGLNSALLEAGKSVWVMNVVPTSSQNYLPLILDRGFLGVLHDWCEAFPTYPRTYDMVHADGLLSLETNQPKRCTTLDLFTEIDKLLRPEGWVILHDTAPLIETARALATRLKWDATRGFSFTRALLGIPADELHLCGDPAVVPLIQEILGVTDDSIQVQYYERLLPLVPSKVPLGSFSNIKTGDCIVTFSRREIYRLKREIEERGKHLCSVVYGSLPPETRTRQATMFNDESSEFDVLVASDAIGMGLNLNISRIIFSTLKKFNGTEMRDLTVPEIKQIAGRAGRYGSKFPIGEVTCLDAEDIPFLHSSLKSPSPTLQSAGLFPTFDLLLLYSRLHPRTGLHPILARFLEKAKLSPNYFIADCEEMLKVAAVIDELPLQLHDKYLFCISPVDMSDDISSQGLTQYAAMAEQFAENYAKKGLVRLREIFTPGTLQVPKTQIGLQELESIHKEKAGWGLSKYLGCLFTGLLTRGTPWVNLSHSGKESKVLDLYVWLSYRLEDSFPDRELAASQKSMCSLLIEEFLERLGWQRPNKRRLSPRSGRRSVLEQQARR